MEWLYALLDKFELFISSNVWFAPLSAFILPFIEALIPSLPLSVLVAFNLNIMQQVYGEIVGTGLTVFLSVLGSFAGMFLIFGLIRLTLEPYFARKVQNHKYGKMFLEIAEGSKSVPILLLMSNPFLPSSIINYALSLTKIKTGRYIWLTIVSRFFVMMFLILLGSLFDVQNHLINIVWFTLAYSLLFVLWYIWFRIRRRKKENIK
ncbi:MAG TPA: VTT domain-containing protein [Bacillota bacterium]|nr:VTT domain-containing protein [Bacillota bacterium]HPF42658.1 VTT domain-containing protein [Bacillota bacterium]HPJ85519.1 VTT domain-containing protein [Bacillota bacterium]HPQ62091.1 VTT domain-containing protein [Bacillota bacterium]